MPFVLVLIGLVVLVLLVVLGMRKAATWRGDLPVDPQTLPDDAETLTYRVPEGVDPAPLVKTLEEGGYQVASLEYDVIVSCPAGREQERARVREILAHAPLGFERGPEPREIRFADEQGGAR